MNHINEALEEASGKTALPTGQVLTVSRITAMLGIILLPLLALQIYTTTNIHGLVTLHEVVGCIIVGVLLFKTTTVIIKLMSYYLNRPGFENSAPPLIYRITSPLFMLICWIILISGLLMVTGHRTYMTTVAGISLKAWHETGWIGFLVLLAIHLFGRTVPAFRLVATLWTQTSGSGWARPLVFGLASLSIFVGSLGAVWQHSHKGVWKYSHVSSHGQQTPPGGFDVAAGTGGSSVASSGGS
jgi:hypothetical protein